MTGSGTDVAASGALWTLLANMRIEEAGARRGFEDNLAAENRWSAEHARRVSREYRRFLYIAACADFQVTPSDAVDRAWHLHLTYSRHYWDELCGNILGRPLHHVPSDGGAGEDQRFGEQYRQTLALYRRTFGETPPAEIWPVPAAAVPSPHPLSDGRAASRDVLAPLAILLVIGGIWIGSPLGVVAVVLGALLLLPLAFSRRRRKPAQGGGSCAGGSGCGGGSTSREPSGSDSPAGCAASCGGGCGGD